MQLQSVPGEPPRPDELAARALADRGVLLLSGALTDDNATDLVSRVLAAPPTAPALTLHVTNVTGSIALALMIHDLLRSSEPTVRTIGGGMLDTAGALIVHAGAAGERELLATTRIHVTRVKEPATPGLDLESGAQEVAQLRSAAASALGIDLDRPRILSATDAVAAGIADRISLTRK